MPYLISLNLLLLKDIAYIGSWMHLVFVFVCVCVCVSLSLSFRNSRSWSLSSPDDKVSENIWFVWSRTSHGGDKWRCHHGDRRTDNRTSEYRATLSMDTVRLSFAICWCIFSVFIRPMKVNMSRSGALVAANLDTKKKLQNANGGREFDFRLADGGLAAQEAPCQQTAPSHTAVVRFRQQTLHCMRIN